MGFLSGLIMTIQLLSAVGMIFLILLQHGKGADMGAAFGSGSSGSLFGATGGANFLSRTTAVLAAVFFVCTLALAFVGGVRPDNSSSVLGSVPATAAPVAQQAEQAAPVVPTEPAKAVDQIPAK
ncbi:preprotein translocase subunit SecG [Curvibacter sp. CHRR-16]|uniref:preprotein translocase subunit SecG n=1 Tax=Curvibacter sp. CHRR-16 TaxID=2835872 RepID=UPI001BDB33C7|nr:preprotein translocase subunit SecG [Curvibacter sp. CHRR-16]MBT0571475.1 preprotein translocase subunit SecG [Curvibacter sp. CHRR-16]